MIDSIVVRNMDTLKSVTLDKTSGSAYMLETDGIKWGTAKATHNTISNLTGVGNIVTSSTIQDRTVSITGRICPVHTTKELARLYNTSDPEEIASYKKLEIKTKCADLSKLVNPLSALRIYAGAFYIEGRPTGSLTLSEKWGENNEIYKRFTFSLECADPMFYLKSKSSTYLSGITGGFRFPLTIPKTDKMHFGDILKYQLVLIENLSDKTSGGILYMKSLGTVENPSITDVYSQKQIKIHKTLTNGETLKIDTINRTIQGSVNGVDYESYLQYWDWENDWIEFPVGNSLMGYSADNDTYGDLLVWVELQQSIYTLEDA